MSENLDTIYYSTAIFCDTIYIITIAAASACTMMHVFFHFCVLNRQARAKTFVQGAIIGTALLSA